MYFIPILLMIQLPFLLNSDEDMAQSNPHIVCFDMKSTFEGIMQDGATKS